MGLGAKIRNMVEIRRDGSEECLTRGEREQEADKCEGKKRSFEWKSKYMGNKW